MLSSPQNPRVKHYVELRVDGNIRRAAARFLMEGQRAVGTALALPHIVVHEVIFSEQILGDDLALVERARERGIPLARVSKDVFRKIADVMTPQGIAAVVKIPEWDRAEVFGRAGGLLAVACGLQDPGNLGTLIRSCEASGASGLVALEGTADPFNAKVVRATAGGLLTLPILRMKAHEFLDAARRHAPGLRLVASAAQGGIPHRAFDWQARPIALCIGSEGAGLPEEVERACTEKVTIPILGRAESLNAAVAASILLFEAQANRKG